MFRNTLSFVRKVFKTPVSLNRISKFGTNATKSSSKYFYGIGALALGTGVYLTVKNFETNPLILTAQAATAPQSQSNVFSGTKNHALYLTIHLKPEANMKQVLQVVGSLNKAVDVISPVDLRNDENEVLAGVGFSPNFMDKARPGVKPPHNFSFHERKGNLGTMPSTGGDIFIHAKCDEYSKLFELSQHIVKALGDNVAKFEDIYGWVYRYGRDLSGFIDGTENAADEESRHEIAVNKTTGGAFVMTQKWLHKHDIINREKDSTKEGWVGRSISDSTELRRKAATSHVARMTGGANFQQPKVHQIVRQSQPFGSVAGPNGLFFIAYSSNPAAFDYMLDRMVGADKDSLCDDIMRLSECVTGAYWYVPGVDELKKMTGQ